jgi:hypothetical protein
MNERVAYSFIVDRQPKFAYQGWLLAKSLEQHCAAQPGDIHIQVTAEVSRQVRSIFADAGFTLHDLEKFGDGTYCNKIAQLPHLESQPFDRLVLLDTDTIVVADLRPFLGGDALQAKVVDLANPALSVLTEIHAAAGGAGRPRLISVDAAADLTFLGNANGGFYALPRALVRDFAAAWRHWAEWLLAHDEPLRRAGKLAHIDQVGVALAVEISRIAFSPAPANVNYFIHFDGPHRHLDRPIALLHYHDVSMNVLGLLEPPFTPEAATAAAIAQANRQITQAFQNTLFWDYRYAAFPDRGSGIGSRGGNLDYKRNLLRREGVEAARSILDIGCGDFEVLRDFTLADYLGIDLSSQAVAKSRAARPDLQFALYEGQDIPEADMVLCFEVLIHQESKAAYDALIRFMAARARKTLIVSGYEQKIPHHMVYFHERLSMSLAATQRFGHIEAIGGHTDVVIYRCDV